MSDDRPSGPSSAHTGRSPRPRRTRQSETVTEFRYRENKEILRRRSSETEALNEKASSLIRFLGVIFSVYSGFILLFARFRTEPSVTLDANFLNVFTTASVIALGGAVLTTILAYHRTDIAQGPSADYLLDEISEDESVREAKRSINEKVPGWVANNETEIQRDHTRIFNAQMTTLFSLSYLVLGGAFPLVFPDPHVSIYALVVIVAAVATYVVYDIVRSLASPVNGSG
ncbi:hypothetical protein Hbl1158_14535 [Halobaculum sp. CBA1158]|uniref:hypothetical protein n=1 Tax=Halobaculum sp. CBA1158 TaxID=2904243 RepID=UPI001F169728|nr:hypothetical protein [Halobaculum sp. CBA1158]UIO99721.1 hypothetical protein Hbl1158_14535 [Halobaculum sp. CBA1158]